MKKILTKTLFAILTASLVFVSCKKTEVTPSTNNNNNTSGANFTWNGVTHNSSAGTPSAGLTLSEKLCGIYFVYSYSLITEGSNSYASYIYLYLPSNGEAGNYAIENYVGTSSGSSLTGNKAWLYVYNLTTSGSSISYDYGYAASGSVSVQKNGDGIIATFADIDTYSTSNFSTGTISKGKLSGTITTNSLTYDLSSYDCNVTTTPGTPIDTTGTGTGTGTNDDNPLIGTLSFSGNNFPVHKDDLTFITINNVTSAYVTTSTVSGVNTITGSFYLSFKSAGDDLEGDYDIIDYTGSGVTEAGKATYFILTADQNGNLKTGYAVSGKITVTAISGGKANVSLVDVILNTNADGSGTDLGLTTGAITASK